jgi:hypothetical protein
MGLNSTISDANKAACLVIGYYSNSNDFIIESFNFFSSIELKNIFVISCDSYVSFLLISALISISFEF